MAKKTPTARQRQGTRPPAHAGHTATRPKRIRPAPTGSSVTVRMYRLQLGDCFLLTFPADDGGKFHMLIDCGLIKGAPNPAEAMQKVARDIAEQTDNELDLVLITHEHWDHLSGFTQARDVFEKIRFKRLWLGWTEDPTNALAEKLRAERKARQRTLQRAVEHLRATPGGAVGPGVALAEALQAFTVELEAAGDAGTAGALEWVKEHAGAGNTTYCKPGDRLELPGVSAAQIYVLGPPEDEQLLHRSAPGGRHPETYLGPAEEQLRLLLDDAAGAGVGQPFDEPFRLDWDAAKKDPFFREHYGADADAWRRIDADWQGLIGPLALQLDSDTNNTSLAVAVELLPGRRVLLFPGDAQVGNWLSWQSLRWPDSDGAEGAGVTVNDLFARTVLYKVGHHGSYNATLKEEGLERMTGDGLLAMLPVDEQFANTVKHWRMPWPDLLTSLVKHTGGHILRADLRDAAFPGAEVNELFFEVSLPTA